MVSCRAVSRLVCVTFFQHFQSYNSVNSSLAKPTRKMYKVTYRCMLMVITKLG